MKAFAELFERLDQTTKTNEKTAAMSDFFRACLSDDPGTPPRIDAAWAVAYLSGRRSKDTRTRRLVPTRLLRQWAAAEASIPDWLLDESYDRVGDLAETITLLVPEHHNGVVSDRPLSRWLTDHVLPLSGMDESQQRHAVTTMWRESSGTTRLILMKLITGGFRLGVSARLVARGLADATDIPADVIAHRLMGNWKPDAGFLERLTSTDTDDASCSRPYPFCLAHAVPTSSSDDEKASSTCESLDTIASLGPLNEFIAEWKWDGIRGQVIRRGGQTFVWSRGEDLMEGRFPEVESAAEFLPNGTVLDGEILASCVSTDLAEHPSGIEVLPFAQLQRRIGRKTVGKKLLADVPVMFHAFDCLEFNGIDLREQRLDYRQQVLRDLVADHQPPNLVINPPITASGWSELIALRQTSRVRNAEGLMLKRRDSPYHVGRVRGSWWKWKIAPYTVDAVLIYAQRGHGKRASLYTDYTFAVWDDTQLVPFAKAYSGLTDDEIRKVDRFVRNNTQQRFGPVRSVQPELVMELAFEGLQRSTRHKSGIATRFPRIVRWRHDKQPRDADKLTDLLAMLAGDDS